MKNIPSCAGSNARPITADRKNPRAVDATCPIPRCETLRTRSLVVFDLTDRSGCGKTLWAYGQRIYRESLGASKANWYGIAVATALRLTFRELQAATPTTLG